MKTLLAAIGFVIAAMWLLGAIGAADFYLCFKPVGAGCMP